MPKVACQVYPPVSYRAEFSGRIEWEVTPQARRYFGKCDGNHTAVRGHRLGLDQLASTVRNVAGLRSKNGDLGASVFAFLYALLTTCTILQACDRGPQREFE
jgi:hypothetical protein